MLEALEDEQQAATGKGNPQRAMEIALLKKREGEIGAYSADDDDMTEEAAA